MRPYVKRSRRLQRNCTCRRRFAEHIRITPAVGREIALLAISSILLSAYVVVRRPCCSVKTAGIGGVLVFIGVACPVCNKVALLLFGGDLLLTYFKPVRVYVAATRVLLAVWAAAREWARTKRESAEDTAF